MSNDLLRYLRSPKGLERTVYSAAVGVGTSIGVVISGFVIAGEVPLIVAAGFGVGTAVGAHVALV